MKKIVLTVILSCYCSLVYGQGFGTLYPDKAAAIKLDRNKIQGLLKASNPTVQTAIEALSFISASNTTIESKWNFAGLTLPQGTTCPSSCSEGDICYDTNATAGQRIYACESSVWTLQGDGGGAGSGYATVQEEGSSLPQRTTLNFTGSDITVTDDAANSRSQVRLPDLLQPNDIDTSNKLAAIMYGVGGTGAFLRASEPTANIRITSYLEVTTRPNFTAYQSCGKLYTGAVGDLLCGVDGGGSGSGAPTDATYITQTTNGTLTNEQDIASLSSGLLSGANGTGVISSITTSAGVAGQISDETGSGNIVFASDIDISLRSTAYLETTRPVRFSNYASCGNLATDSAGNIICQETPPQNNIVRCGMYENLISTDDNMLFFAPYVSTTATRGTCKTSSMTTQPTITWEDDAGTAISGDLGCSSTGVWVAFSGAAATLTINEAIRFDVANTPAPVTGTQTLICVEFVEN